MSEIRDTSKLIVRKFQNLRTKKKIPTVSREERKKGSGIRMV